MTQKARPTEGRMPNKLYAIQSPTGVIEGDFSAHRMHAISEWLKQEKVFKNFNAAERQGYQVVEIMVKKNG